MNEDTDHNPELSALYRKIERYEEVIRSIGCETYRDRDGTVSCVAEYPWACEECPCHPSTKP